MSFFNLKLIRNKNGKLILTIPLYTRIIMLFFASAVAMSFIYDPEFSFLPAFFLTVLLFSALYKESWVFDKEKKEVIYGFGILFLYKKTVVPFSAIENFRLEGFVKGSMTAKPGEERESKEHKIKLRTEYWKLSIINSTYGELTINTVKGRQKEVLLNYAKEICSFCGVKLIED